MDGQLLIIMGLTFLIHIIGTLAYSIRIAGTRTGRIAVTFSLFNILVLISRMSNSFQAPLLANRVEQHLHEEGTASQFRWLLLSASLATLVGGLLIPTFQRLFAKAVDSFSSHKSVPKLLWRAMSPAGMVQLRESMALPSLQNLSQAAGCKQIPMSMIVLNTIAMAIWTVGVFSSLYAGHIDPAHRLTSGQLSGVINGIATILMFVFVDPSLSVLTDDTVHGKVTDPFFRRTIVWLVGSRLAGTALAQVLLLPAASWIAIVARHL